MEDEIEQVAARVEADPGDWLTLCRGDQNMAGDFIRTVSGPRLYDFDAAGPRHALLEGMPGRLTWGCMMRIPEAAIAPMEEAYRSELSQFIPVAANLRAYQIGMADAGARWHIFHVLSRLSEALKLERPRGPSSLRQQTIAWLRAFVRLTDDVGGYPALGSTAKGLVETVTKLWTDEQTELPWYPAFAVTST